MSKDKIYITLEVDDKGTAVVRGFDKNTERAFDKMKRNAKASSESMGSSLAKLKSHWLAITAAMTGVVLAGKKFVDAASNLQETTGKFNVVFADQIQIAEQWSRALVASYAMSTRESKQYLSSVQDLLVPMGMAAKEAGKMSFEVVKLAADLGSFNNVPTAQVMADIESALVGNFETMKKYGVVLNATVVQEKALAMGLTKTKDELTAGQRAQAAYALMVKGSQAAIGDMARTHENYANQVKQYEANIEDMAAKLGTKLLPAMTNIVTSLGFVARMIGEGVVMIDILNVSMLKGLNFLLSGLEKFYNLLGKLPGFLGEPYRDAAKAVRGYRDEISGMIKAGEEIIMEQILMNDKTDQTANTLKNQAGPAIEDHVKKVKKTVDIYKDWYSELAKVIKQQEQIKGPTVGEFLKEQDLTISGGRHKVSEAEWEGIVSPDQAGLKAIEDFNAQYAELGKSRYDLEREQLEMQAKLWAEAGVDKVKLAELTANKIKAIDRAELQSRISTMQDFAGSMADNFKNIAEMGGKENSKAFAMWKAFKIAETIMATYSAAMKAFDAMAWIPVVGPALGIAAAGMVIGFGMQQIAAIKSAQPASYDQGGISRAGGIYRTGNIDEAHIPLKSGKVPVSLGGSGGGGASIIINMDNPVFQDVATQRQVFAQIAEVIARRVAPGAVVQNYRDDGDVRKMVRGRI